MVIPSPERQEVSLYIHVPFCTKKCPYCHFYVLPDKEPLHQLLLQGLQREIEYWSPTLTDKNIISIYFGGGTPSLMGSQAIKTILELIPSSNREGEITLEANPEGVSVDLIKSFVDVGINRISFGVQSFDDMHLKELGRNHSAQQAMDAVRYAHLAGLSNITIDLMYELPDQGLARWNETLKRAADLPITHLSLYNLTIEPNTIFDLHREKLEKKIPDERVRIQMYENAIEILELSGLKQYEISAFAKPGYYSRHNTGYWLGRPFLGFGPSAFSYWEGRRFRNIANLSKYHEAITNGALAIDFEETLPADAKEKELFVIQLRLRQGVALEHLSHLDKETLTIVNNLQEQGLLDVQNDRIKLTRQGLLLYDTVASLLI